MIIEACCDTIEESILAEKQGATRIEFCSALSQDGLTPKKSDIELLLRQISVPVRIMVRPTNTFNPSLSEVDEMIQTIMDYNAMDFEGYVMGMLNVQQTVDFFTLKRVLSYVGDKKVCFHKAIDASYNMISDVKLLNSYTKIDTILTSGGATTAWKGREQILTMQRIYHGTIMAAGKITKQNLFQHQETLKLNAYHGRKIV